MLLGAVVHAGVPISKLKKAIAGLKVKGLSLSAQPGHRGGVEGMQVTVELDDQARRPRRWQQLVGIVEDSPLPRKVVERTSAVFRRMAEAEAAVHGGSPNDTVLHELGNYDTLADVVGSVLGLELLGIERLYSSPFPSGSGVVKSDHGPLPVPAPATAALFAMARAPVVPPPGGVADAGEMVTPTGAAVISTLATFRQPVLRMEAIGYGLGTRESTSYPNVLGLWIGEEAGTAYVSDLTLIETNVDDMSAELLGYVQERLFDLGARDVWFSSIQMKKGRPATMVSALVPEDLESQAVGLVMRETTTLGVRVRPVSRYEAERDTVDVETSLGAVAVKVKKLEGRNVAVSPEYEACRQVALAKELPLAEVYRQVQAEASEQLLS